MGPMYRVSVERLGGEPGGSVQVLRIAGAIVGMRRFLLSGANEQQKWAAVGCGTWLLARNLIAHVRHVGSQCQGAGRLLRHRPATLAARRYDGACGSFQGRARLASPWHESDVCSSRIQLAGLTRVSLRNRRLVRG